MEFEGLEARFAAIHGVERVAWDDREHFLLKLRKGTDLGDLREVVRRALREAHEAATTSDPRSSMPRRRADLDRQLRAR